MAETGGIGRAIPPLLLVNTMGGAENPLKNVNIL